MCAAASKPCFADCRCSPRPPQANTTPLHAAAECPSPDCVALLIAAGANVAARDACGETPLHFATRDTEAFTACAKLLIDAGSSVNKRSRDGITPLHVAAKRGSRACVRLLLRSGAAINARDKARQYAQARAPGQMHRSCATFAHESRRSALARGNEAGKLQLTKRAQTRLPWRRRAIRRSTSRRCAIPWTAPMPCSRPGRAGPRRTRRVQGDQPTEPAASSSLRNSAGARRFLT